jgi:hypothetical protein
MHPTGRKQVITFDQGELSAGSPKQQFVVLEVEANM